MRGSIEEGFVVIEKSLHDSMQPEDWNAPYLSFLLPMLQKQCLTYVPKAGRDSCVITEDAWDPFVPNNVLRIGYSIE